MNRNVLEESNRPWQIAFGDDTWACTRCENFIPEPTEIPVECMYCAANLYHTLGGWEENASLLRVNLSREDAHLVKRRASVAFRVWYGVVDESFPEPVRLPDYSVAEGLSQDYVTPLVTLGPKELVRDVRPGQQVLTAFVSEDSISDWILEDLGSLFPQSEEDLVDLGHYSGVTRFVSRFALPGRILLLAAPSSIEIRSLDSV